ncbi:MAG: hypothetical protein QOJ11_3486 [Frankiales bacterium]|jgi:hypothetical protein|nr:hypothetical protein [Frankiales bacterium]
MTLPHSFRRIAVGLVLALLPLGTPTEAWSTTTAPAVISDRAMASDYSPSPAAGMSKGKPSSLAPSLVMAVTQATTTKARMVALETMLGALQIAVRDARTGHWVVRGPLRSEREGYLYSAEVKQLALAIAARRSVSLAAVAAAINAGGYSAAKASLTAGTLAAALVDTAKASRSLKAKDNKGWLLIRIVRELGRHRHQDPASTSPPRLRALDPLQAALVVLEFTAPLTAYLPVVTHTRQLTVLSHGIVAATPPKRGISASVCEKLSPLLKAGVKVMGALTSKWINKYFYRSVPVIGYTIGTEIPKMAELIAKAGKVAGVLLDAIHEFITAFGIDVTTIVPTMPIALGSNGHPGKPVPFGLQVDMLLDTPNVLVKCGYLANMSIPGKGPVPGVWVSWLTGGLESWGTVEPNGVIPGHLSATDAAGRAWLTFTPKADPGRSGPLQLAEGKAIATAWANVSLQGPAGAIEVFADAARTTTLPWQVSFHLPLPSAIRMTAHQSWHYDGPTGHGFIDSTCWDWITVNTERDYSATVPLTANATLDTTDPEVFLRGAGADFVSSGTDTYVSRKMPDRKEPCYPPESISLASYSPGRISVDVDWNVDTQTELWMWPGSESSPLIEHWSDADHLIEWQYIFSSDPAKEPGRWGGWQPSTDPAVLQTNTFHPAVDSGITMTFELLR